MTPFFPPIDPKKSFSEIEKGILAFWKQNKIFEKTVDSRPKEKGFVFFDGPPFATGLPHYGHILAGTLKDAIPRYWTMKGYRVERKFGWDCHGVPVEFQVEKENQIGGKPGIEKMGVVSFNELCRSIVLRCADEWEESVDRMGRFVDFQDSYRTMDAEYIESVWWVFAELWKKGLIYQGEKVVSYSPKLASPLSNFEANLNYKDIDDPAVTVKFKITNDELGMNEEGDTYFLAWTTTPWTIPSDLALAVNKEIEYAKVEFESEYYICAKNLVEQIFGKVGEFEIVETFKGLELIGRKYKPPFSFYEGTQNAFQILAGDFVSDSDGTGIVHLAPTGEDDARILQANDIPLFYPFTEHCYFDDSLPELRGKYFRSDPEVAGSKENNANDWVIDQLKEKGLLFSREQIRHSYPHCWRTECALMYRGIDTWFVNVQKIKVQLIEENKNINWIPSHLKDGRFGKILENAPDWAISRNRYWGAPIPVWKCETCGSIEVISSRAELESRLSDNRKVSDLHKHFVDDLTWECSKCHGTVKRIPEVLDCWFESGAMPYASKHYPFDEKLRIRNEELGIENMKTEIDPKLFLEKIQKVLPEQIVDFKIHETGWDSIVFEINEKWIFKFPRRAEIQKAYVREKEVLKIFEPISPIKVPKIIFETDEFFGYEKICGKKLELENLKKLDTKTRTKFAKKCAEFLAKLHSTEFSKDFESVHFDFEKFQKKVLPTVFSKISLTARKNSEKFFQKFSGNPELLKYEKTATHGDFGHGHIYFDGDEISGVIDFGDFSVDDPAYDFSGIFVDLGEDFCNEVLNSYDLKADKNFADRVDFYQKRLPFEIAFHALERKNSFDFNFGISKIEEVFGSQDFPPADFIAEGLDQTRGWFYTLHVLGVALFGKNIYKNVVTNGIVLAEDGQKMSKSKKNYPDPNILFEKYGADAMRFYLLSSPAVRAESLRFSEKGVEEVLKSVLIPLQNAYSFFSTYANIDGWEPSSQEVPEPKTELDQWMISEFQKANSEFKSAFDRYEIDTALRVIPEIIDALTNWYIRRSRDRFWASGMNSEKISGYETLYFVLKEIAKILAPVCPFYADALFKNLVPEKESVHLEYISQVDESLIDETLSKRIHIVREIVRLSAGIRARKKIKLRQPLQKLRFALSKGNFLTEQDIVLIREESNVKEVQILESLEGVAKKILQVNARKVGPRLGSKVQEVIRAGKEGNFSFFDDEKVEVLGEVLSCEEYELGFLCSEGQEGEGTKDSVVVLDTEISEALEREGIARELIRNIQELRKQKDFSISDRIGIVYSTDSEKIRQVFDEFSSMISSETLAEKVLYSLESYEMEMIDIAEVGEVFVSLLKKDEL